MRWIGALIAIALAAPTAARAQGEIFNRTGSGARAAGMANAFIAISDDGTAASWNPAGLGQLRKPELSIVSSLNAQSFRLQGYRTLDDLSAFSPIAVDYTGTYLDFASLAIPLTIAGKPVTLQGSWRRLYELELRENASTRRMPLTPQSPPPLTISSNEDTVGGVDLISVAGAVKLTSRLALGGSYNLWRGDWTIDQTVSTVPLEIPGPGEFLSTRDINRLRGDSVSLGLLLTYPRWSVGVLRQGAVDGDFTGRYAATSSTGPPVPLETIEGSVYFPQALGVGAAWHPAANWTTALDMTWDEWSRATLHSEAGETVDLFSGVPPELSATQNTVSVSAGAEHLFHGDGFVVPLRFGAAWEPQGPRSPYTRDPVRYVLLAAGAGFNTNSLKFDAAVQYRWASSLDGASFSLGPADAYLPEAVGQRRVRSWTVKLSLIVRLTDTEKLGRVLRSIFGG